MIATKDVVKKILSFIFKKPLTWLARKVSASPKKEAIFSSLNQLLANIRNEKNATVIPFDLNSASFIIFSDQHKGIRDFADDFRSAEFNYISALKYYYENGFTLIMLGDCEELWENTPSKVIESNRLNLLEEAKFLQKKRYFRVFGNHDLEWKYAVQQTLYLKPIFGADLSICEAILLKTILNGKDYQLLLTHGHQGDQRSDGNAFSKWVVAAIWTPLQRYFEIYMDTVSDDFELVDKHNILYYEWSAAQRGLVLITGHTHKPVFASLDHIDRLAKSLKKAEEESSIQLVADLKKEIERRKKDYAGKKILKTMARPCYFNSGCCCFNDGDMTGIEIHNGMIRMIKWEKIGEESKRRILEEAELSYVFELL